MDQINRGFEKYYNQKMEMQSPEDFFAQQNKQIVLAKENVKLQFYFSGIFNGGYRTSFIVHISTPIPGQIRASQISMNSLKQAILDNVNPKDYKYLTLTNFSTNKAEFVFDDKKWLDDNFKNIELKKEFSIFNRRILFKTQLPEIIRFESLRNNFTQFIQRKIKEKITKDRMEQKKFIPFLPKEFVNTINKQAVNLFEYSYDVADNCLYIKLKSAIILTATLIMSAAIKNSKTKDLNNGNFFDSSLKNKLKDHNKDWKTFIDKKFHKD